MSRSSGSYHHGNLPQALAQAALGLLAEQPAHEISLRAVARAAGVSHNAPYHHFGDRTGLLKALAEQSMGALVDQVRAAMEARGASGSDLVRGGLAYVDFAVQRPHAFDAIYDPTICVPGSPTATMAPLIEDLEGLLGTAAAASGLGAEDEISALWGQMHGLATLAQAGHLSAEQARAAWLALAGRLGA